jgi:hypothetical protein
MEGGTHLAVRGGAPRPRGPGAYRPVAREHGPLCPEGCDHAPREGHPVTPGVCTLGRDCPRVRDLGFELRFMGVGVGM